MQRAALAALIAALALSGCGDDPPATPGATATATAASTATTAPTAAATATTESGNVAIWPPSDQAADDPLAVARSFVADYIGLSGTPELGDLAEGEPGAGEIAVYRRGEDGARLESVLTTLSLRQLDGANWSITSAQSDEVELTAPEPLATVTSPLTVSGRGRGFEGNVVLEVRAEFATLPLVAEPVIAGSMQELEPFSADLTFDPPPTPRGAVVARTGSGIDAANGFAAVAVRFAG